MTRYARGSRRIPRADPSMHSPTNAAPCSKSSTGMEAESGFWQNDSNEGRFPSPKQACCRSWGQVGVEQGHPRTSRQLHGPDGLGKFYQSSRIICGFCRLSKKSLPASDFVTNLTQANRSKKILIAPGSIEHSVSTPVHSPMPTPESIFWITQLQRLFHAHGRGFETNSSPTSVAESLAN